MRGMEPEAEQAERGMGARTVGDECRIIRVLRGDELSVYPSHIIPFHIISYHIISYHSNLFGFGGSIWGKRKKVKMSVRLEETLIWPKKRKRRYVGRTP